MKITKIELPENGLIVTKFGKDILFIDPVYDDAEWEAEDTEDKRFYSFSVFIDRDGSFFGYNDVCRNARHFGHAVELHVNAIMV